MDKIVVSQIAQNVNRSFHTVKNVLQLLNDGATIPFIARYRKEVSGSMDEVLIGRIQKEHLAYTEMLKRKSFILGTIADQNKLSDTLKKEIETCWDPTRLEDLYLPYKKKRKTRAVTAIENGLEALADRIWMQHDKNLIKYAGSFLGQNVKSVGDALQGARDIIAERISEDAMIRDIVRLGFERSGRIHSKVKKGKIEQAEKYRDYFDYEEKADKTPAHRMLAVFRGESEGLLRVKIKTDEERLFTRITTRIIKKDAVGPCRKEIYLATEDGLKRLLLPSIETEYRNICKTRADGEAIDVFSENLRQLLLAPPVGSRNVMGIDPGFRSGCKIVCLDANGVLKHNTTIYPHPPQNKYDAAKEVLIRLAEEYNTDCIAVGNGTAGRETFSLLKSIFSSGNVQIFLVNENGASIYSASEIAREEFPDLDLTVRGAVSIGRRLMDPLSELVKIDPKSIGVGQYQHDVNQVKLRESLTHCVERCVNAVGINLNTASRHLLTYVSGLGPTLANNIVEFRSLHGSFSEISELKKVNRMGEKAFEQSAGFLRIRNGSNPLDNTGVHPERYHLVNRIAADYQTEVHKLIGHESLLKSIDLSKYTHEDAGMPTLVDIQKELLKPGFDIRGKAKSFSFSDGIEKLEDLRPGMVVKGIINNITRFGAFVDIGVKEAGLIHISQLSDQFVKDPLDFVKLNQEVNARVLNVDIQRRRISLSLKSPD